MWPISAISFFRYFGGEIAIIIVFSPSLFRSETTRIIVSSLRNNDNCRLFAPEITKRREYNNLRFSLFHFFVIFGAKRRKNEITIISQCSLFRSIVISQRKDDNLRCFAPEINDGEKTTPEITKWQKSATIFVC